METRLRPENFFHGLDLFKRTSATATIQTAAITLSPGGAADGQKTGAVMSRARAKFDQSNTDDYSAES